MAGGTRALSPRHRGGDARSVDGGYKISGAKMWISNSPIADVFVVWAKTDDGSKVVAKMKELPTDDPLFGKGTVRADGRKIHPVYLFEVKKPSESKGPYDYYKVVQTIPADKAFRPLNEGNCPLVAKQ